jgi:hypothetical protein
MIQRQFGRRAALPLLMRFTLVCFAMQGWHATSSGAVIVLANRTGSALTLRFQPTAGRAQQVSLPANDVRPMFVNGGARVEFTVSSQVKQYQVDPNCAYFFGRDSAGRVDMQKIGLGDEAVALPGPNAPAAIGEPSPPAIPVKILVDEEEPALQFAWDTRLRRRIEAASEILQRHSRVQLKVVGVGTWQSDNSTNDFLASLSEFEKEVEPFPARLAIGFTSQFAMVRGRVHMAGTRGPLHSHILVREGSPQVGEAERLEFLVHELGHFLGAAHSPERTSVMRPVLGDNQAGRTGFQIRFDPVNTLIIASVGEEMGRGGVDKFSDLSAGTKRRLRAIYDALSRAMPEDPAAAQFMRYTEATANLPLANQAKRVLRGFVLAATTNRALAPPETPIPGQPARRGGDELTEYLVRQSAGVATAVPEEIAPAALLLALGVGFDDSSALLLREETRVVAQAIETSAERPLRQAMLGEPTLRGRRDLATRFFTAACLTSFLGAERAKELLLAGELDRVPAGRFSFALVAADRAGIRWGADVAKGRFKPEMVATGFEPAMFMPAVDDLPEEPSASEFAARFGSQRDPRFLQQLMAIEHRIGELPLYRGIPQR